MQPAHIIGGAQLFHADCREVLRSLPDNSVDSVVTDPPYALVSIVKRFGKPDSAPAKGDVYARAAAGFMGRSWDTGETAFAVEFWADVLRVPKPGGHVVAFGGTRTQHRLVCAIEDAGFEIRDQIGWLYGSGFPKSHDAAKAIDQAGGMAPSEQASLLKQKRQDAGWNREEFAYLIGCTESSIRDWEEGRSRTAGGTVEFIVHTKKYRTRLADLLGYSTDQRLAIGIATDRRGDNTVIGLGHSGQIHSGGHTPNAAKWKGWGTALKPAWESICVARKPIDGTNADNLIKWGVGCLNIEASRVPSDAAAAAVVEGRWPANIIHDGSDEVVAAFPDAAGQQGDLKGHAQDRKSKGILGDMGPEKDHVARVEINKSAARFFYAAKASKRDRDEGLVAVDSTRGNTHPTVKPTDLMRWLCRLVTPPGGLILDPFMGSGSTGKAALLENFRFIGCEREDEYMPIAAARIAATQPIPANDNQATQLALFA